MWNGEKVAVKQSLPEEAEARAGSQKEINREIRILSRIRHPNIIQLLGSGYEPYRFAILEYMGGGTLSKKMNYTNHRRPVYGNNKLPQSKVMEYAMKLADALAYMHEYWHPGIRLMHRDLKADNVAFTESGEIKLIDFGLCYMFRKAMQEDILLPLHGGVGTWRYWTIFVILVVHYTQE